MKMFIELNWVMFRVSLAISLSMFVLTGFDAMSLGLIPMIMMISLITSVLFFEKDKPTSTHKNNSLDAIQNKQDN